MPLSLYNTLARKIEPVRPLKKSAVGLYTCGPTVYDEAHIGNLRSYIFADVLRRALEFDGYKVHWVMNVTDVDDKTIKRTVDEFGPKSSVKDLETYTERYYKKFLTDLAAVNIPAEKIKFIKVSEKMEEIKKFIKELIKLGYAYKAGDGVYFSIEKYQKKFKDYGDLVGKNFLGGKKVGARVKVDEYDKENLSDFALWKARDKSDGDIFWSDPELGDGRPGWHIECSVVNRVAFGGTPTDIHTGGVDLIFPHHTNEIAQSQPFYKPFVRYWAHCEHLLVESKKMAKREGNFYTLGDLKKELPEAGLAFRYLALQTHYRAQMNFTKEALEAAYAGLKRLSALRYETPRSELKPDETYEDDFLVNLNDDLNTAGALRTLWRLVGYKDTGDRADKMAEVLGLRFLNPEIPKEIRDLARKREEARRNKQFAQSDRLRAEINRLGYEVDDTSNGPVIRPR